MSVGYTKTILCFANSRKMSGRCIAGKEIGEDNFKGWIRPVSLRLDKELSVNDIQYENLSPSEPVILDYFKIDLLRPDNHNYQPENHINDQNVKWEFLGRVDFETALMAVDPIQPSLWGLQSDSSYHGQHDRVPVEEAAAFNYSLKLIEVEDLKIRVLAEGARFNDFKKKIRGYFSYSGQHYALTVTDPVMDATYLSLPLGWFDVGRALLCVSLGEPYKGHAYKLIAGVILPD